MTKIIDWKTLAKMLPYSRQHILRLEKAGRFPKRVRIGQHRVGWVEAEIEEWVMAHINDRDSS